MAKIIDINDKLLEIKDPAMAHAIEVLFDRLDKELRAGLGLESDSDDEEELPLYEYIQSIYDEAGDGCLFCDSRIDPNDKEQLANSNLCFMCEYKLHKLKQMEVFE